MVSDGHRGLVLPDPISNSEVKQASVPRCTVLRTGNVESCHLTFSLFSSASRIKKSLTKRKGLRQSKKKKKVLGNCRGERYVIHEPV